MYLILSWLNFCLQIYDPYFEINEKKERYNQGYYILVALCNDC